MRRNQDMMPDPVIDLYKIAALQQILTTLAINANM